jgi:hypothetical protein
MLRSSGGKGPQGPYLSQGSGLRSESRLVLSVLGGYVPIFYLKAMTTMRLLGEDINYTFTPVANPLVQVRSEVDE